MVESVARNANWKDGEAGDGRRGRGIGFAKYKNLSVFVAVIAEVEVDAASGVIKVPRAFAVADAGQIVNPDGLTNQIQGGIIQSTSWTLHEQVRFNRDGITSRDWQGYPILTMQEVPHVAVELIDRPSEKSLGAGEGAQGPAVAAIVNAFLPSQRRAAAGAAQPYTARLRLSAATSAAAPAAWRSSPSSAPASSRVSRFGPERRGAAYVRNRGRSGSEPFALETTLMVESECDAVVVG